MIGRVACWIPLTSLLLNAQTPAELSELSQQYNLMLPPATADRSPSLARVRDYLNAHQHGPAALVAGAIIRAEPSNWEGFFWYGFATMQQKNLYASIKNLRQAERLSPPSNTVVKVLALAYYLLDQRLLFRAKMEEAIVKNPADFAPYYFLGRYLYSTEDNPAAAAPFFLKALDCSPRHAPSIFFLGASLEAVGKLEQARREYLRAIATAEEQHLILSLPYQGLSRLALQQQDARAALDFAKKAVAIEPRKLGNQLQLARAAAIAGQQDDQREALEAAIAIDPPGAAARYQLFRLERKMGNISTAQEHLAEFRRRLSCYGTE